jgi:SPP1 gp7 family putative phage head morphogenesis protein
MTERLIDQASRHNVYVQRFAGYINNLFDPYMNRLRGEVRAILMDGPVTTSSIARINRLTNEYRRAAIVIMDEYNEDQVLNELLGFSANESEFELASLKSVINSPSVTLQLPAANQVWAAVNSIPLVIEASNNTNLLEPFLRQWEATTIRNVNDIIRTGFITGRTSDQIVRDILDNNTGVLGNNTKSGLRASIKTMVRTATNHVSNIAREQTYNENSDIVIGYEIVSTLDSRTTPICRGYDGAKVFFSGRVVLADGTTRTTNTRPRPPFHNGCRTGTAPILDARFAIDDSDALRASKGVNGGEQVSANSTYYTWLKRQGAQGANGRAFVQDVLGQERGRLFLDGGLSSERFSRLTLDEMFRPIPLSELRDKQSLQLAFDAID